MPDSPRRRTLLKGIGSVGAGGLLAGCSGILGGGGGTGNNGSAPNGSAPANGSGSGGNGTGTGGGTGSSASHTAAVQAPQCDEYTTLTGEELAGGETIEAGCYRVDSSQTVDGGVLTLEAGVVVEFAEDVGLQFSGSGALETTGTVAEPVFLRGQTQERGFWQGLRFEDSNATTNLLANAVVEHAGSTGWHGGEISRAGIFARNSAVELAGATVRSSGRAGLTVPDSATDATITDTVFADNERSARLHADHVGSVGADVVLRDNDADAIMLSGTGTSDAITTDQTVENAGPFYGPKTLIVEGHLTITSGTAMTFSSGNGLDVNGGTLTVDGGADDRVTFDGVEDGRGAWSGIRYTNTASADNALRYADVTGAGGALWHGGERSKAGVYVGGTDVAVSVENCRFESNAVAGLTADRSGDNGVDLTVEHCVFESNERSARLHADLAGDFAPNNEVTGNDADAIMLSGTGTSDTVATDQRWGDPGVPFYAPKTIVVDGGVTVDSGTTMEFDQDAGLDVNGGTLTVDADAENRVTFEGAADGRGTWAGIRFLNTVSADNLLANADVVGAGGELWHGADRSKAGVYVQDTDVEVTIRDVEFRQNAVTALTADGGGSDRADLTVERATFADNAVPMRLHADLVGSVAESVSFQNNDGSYVLVGAQGSATTVTTDATWQALGVPYRVTRHCHCNAGLTVAPGTTIETQANKGFYVPEGSLTADASDSEASILFTDVDDSDGNWQGISFNTTDSGNRFDDVVVENAGNGLWTGNWDSHAAIFVYGGDDNGGLQIQNSTIRGSAGHGIAKSSDGVLSCGGGVTFESIADSPVYEMYTGPIQIC